MESRIKYKSGQAGADGNHHLRDKRIEIRVSSQEYSQLEQRAQDLGYHNLAQYLREAGLTREHLVLPTPRQKEKSEWLYAINRIGNNINQIARHLNMGQDPDDDMLLMLAQIQDMANSALKIALGNDDSWEDV